MKNKTVYYKRVIEIIQKKDYNAEEVCLKLAQERPELFVEFTSSSVDSLTKEIIRLGKANLKIEAIKYHRTNTGSSLKEAKDTVEKIFEIYGIKTGFYSA